MKIFLTHFLADLKKDGKIDKQTINETKKNEGMEFSLYSTTVLTILLRRTTIRSSWRTTRYRKKLFPII
jgi:hypothetical protein